jgi:hypothetical protein
MLTLVLYFSTSLKKKWNLDTWQLLFTIDADEVNTQKVELNGSESRVSMMFKLSIWSISSAGQDCCNSKLEYNNITLPSACLLFFLF